MIAEDIPEAQYGYRAAPETRSVAEMLVHIAVAHGVRHDLAHEQSEVLLPRGRERGRHHGGRVPGSTYDRAPRHELQVERRFHGRSHSCGGTPPGPP